MILCGVWTMSNSGFITLHRRILEWEWWDDHNVTRVFIFLLLDANHTDGRWKGGVVKRGQNATSYSKIAMATGLSVKQVRAATDKLKRTGEIEKKRAKFGQTSGNGNFLLIELLNYEKYQDKGNVRADFGHSLGTERATNNNENNKKKEVPKGTSKKASADIPKPEGIDEQVYQDFLANRRAKRTRSQFTETAYKRLQTEAMQAHMTPQEAMEFAIHKGWLTFTASYYFNDKARKTHGTHQHGNHKSKTERAREAAQRGAEFFDLEEQP